MILDYKIVPAATLDIRSGGTVTFKSYNIKGVGGKQYTGESLETIELGDIGVDDHITGTVDFDVINENSDTLNLSIFSNDQTFFSRDIYIEVTPSLNMNLEIAPRIFVPFVPNQTVLSIKDDSNKAIDSADVTIKLNNSSTLFTGKTDKQGMFAFVLPSCNLGDTVRVIIKKNGYKTIDNSYTINNDLITSYPSQININLDVSKDYFETSTISLLNNTILPLSIKSVTTTIDKKYVDIQTGISQNLLDAGSVTQLEIKTSLNLDSVNLKTQQEFKGDLVVEAESFDLKKTWVSKIPITIRITFGNAVDHKDCLVVNPSSVIIRTEPKGEQEIDFSLKNECSIDSSSISLGNISAKIDWGAKKPVGAFTLLLNDQKFILNDKNQTIILNNMPSAKEIPMKLQFTASNVTSANVSPKIIFSTEKMNVNGVDIISGILNINMIINKYSECIEFPEKIETIACFMGNGYNMMANPLYNMMLQGQGNYYSP